MLTEVTEGHIFSTCDSESETEGSGNQAPKLEIEHQRAVINGGEEDFVCDGRTWEGDEGECKTGMWENRNRHGKRGS